MKITTNHIASTLEEMAYQERGDLGHLILASLLVKKCTDEQLGEAFHEMLTGAFRPSPPSIPVPESWKLLAGAAGTGKSESLKNWQEWKAKVEDPLHFIGLPSLKEATKSLREQTRRRNAKKR